MTRRTALVTGASSGIGEALAHRLVDDGWRVLAGVRSEADAARLAQGASTAGQMVPVRCDVTDTAQIDAAVAAADGRLDAVVANAGIASGGPIEVVDDRTWHDVLDVNVVGVARTVRAALPLLRTSRGRIVITGSVSGRVAAAGVGPYAASKHALVALAEALRLEVAADGIAVTLVEPGAVATGIWDKATASADALEASATAAHLERYGELMALTRTKLADAARSAVAPGEVVEVVVEALDARRPRPRVVVGRTARRLATLLGPLPPRLRHELLRRA